VWWAEPVSRSRGLWSGLKSIGNAFKVVIDYTDPVLSNIINNGISPSTALIPPVITKPPIGIFKIIQKMGSIREKTLGLVPIRAQRDTRMLDLAWAGEETDDREKAIDSGWWDGLDTNPTGDLRTDVKGRCWAIATQQLNRYFGGTLTQDEIVYHGKSHGRPVEKHFPHGLNKEASGWPDIIPTIGFALNIPSMTYERLQGALDLSEGLYVMEALVSLPGWFPLLPPDPFTVITSIETGIPMIVIQANEDYETGFHVMVIDGYRIYADGSVHLHFVGTHNKGTAEWREYAYLQGVGIDVLSNMFAQGIDNLASKKFGWSGQANFYVAFYIPPPNAIGRLTDSRIKSDRDGDGIVDFDEEERFGTDPNKADSDGDGISDKDEIAYYTRKGVDADIDRDGLRAELDVDSDNDGDCDGDENTNKNDRQDDGEYNMMDSKSLDSTRRNCIARPVALLALEQININDRAYCTNGSDYCPIVSMGHRSENAVQLGVSAQIGSILAGSSVWLRSNSFVFGDIHTAGALILQGTTPQVSGTIRQNDEEAAMLVQIYSSLFSSFDKGITPVTMQIPSGQTVTLQPGNHKQNIVVSSGSVLRLQPGRHYIGSLTVQSGGKIELTGSGNVALDIAGSFRWDGSFQGNNIQNAASRLRIRVLDNQNIFLNTSFGGFIIAPNAHVIAGQAGNDYAGQIYAKRITLHQNTRFLWVKPGSQQELNIATLNRGNVHACHNN